MTKKSIPLLVLIVALAATSGFAQRPPDDGGQGGRGREFGPPGFGRGGGPGGPREVRKLVKDFDRDDDGWLNQQERLKAREVAKEGARQGGGFGPPGGPRGRGDRGSAKPGKNVAVNEVKQYPSAGLYDPNVLRTLFFEFENEDWEQELEDFHGTDVDVPAKLTVDGKVLTNVGMRFRGMSSYGMVPSGFKRSFNVSIDLAEKDQRLYGYKTLNLLNSAGDPSFMSTVLYSHIASQYIPVPKANHVHVVINGESWGVYVNVQQYNKDFLKEHFESTKGTRWKVSGSPRADGGLRYLGEDLEEYKSRFEMKSNDGKKAWAALVLLCKTLNETPLEKLTGELEPMLDIDGTLRFLALDVALVNSDGYWTRASDYSLFLDSNKRFHVIPHDMNEAFHAGRRGGPGGPGGGPGGFRGRGRGGFGGPPQGPGDFRPGEFGPDRGGPDRFGGSGEFGPRDGGPGRGGDQRRPDGDGERFSRGNDSPGGPDGPDFRRGRGGFGGPPRGPGGPGHGGVELDPLVSIEDPRMPLRSRLLAVPALREKYLKYVREIAEESLDWEQVEPVIAQHAELIESVVAADTRKLDSLEDFEQATRLDLEGDDTDQGSLRSFFDKRRAFLMNYEEKAEQESSAP